MYVIIALELRNKREVEVRKIRDPLRCRINTMKYFFHTILVAGYLPALENRK